MKEITKTPDYREMEEKVTKMITEKNKEKENEKELNRMTYGEPEEASYKPTKRMTKEQYILSELTKVNTRLKTAGVSKTVTSITNKMNAMGITYDKSDIIWRWFENREFDRIFEADNDAEWYLHYIVSVCRIIKNNPDILGKQRAVYKNGKMVFIKTKMKDYMVDTLQLDVSNPIHAMFIEIIKKVADYFDK